MLFTIIFHLNHSFLSHLLLYKTIICNITVMIIISVASDVKFITLRLFTRFKMALGNNGM